MLKGLAAGGVRGLSAVLVRGMSAVQRSTEGALRGSRDGRRRIIVLDPGLLVPGGHHFEFARLLRTQFGRRYRVAIYGHRSMSPYVVATLRARPLFRENIYPRAGTQPFEELCCAMTSSLLRSLAAVDPADIDAQTIVVMHTTTVFALEALARWYADLAAERRPKLFIQFQHPLEFMVAPRAEWPAAVAAARIACNRLASAGDVRFAANSDVLAQRIARQLGRSLALMPVPVSWPNPLDPDPAPPTAMFGFFGGLRAEKGAAILARAIVAFCAEFPSARFIVHAPRGPSDPAAVALLEPLAQVELIHTGFVRKSDYFRCVRRVRWMLLPYDPEPYALRTSGVFLEALGLGVPVVVTAGTWMARELQSRGGPGIVMAEYSVSSLRACLLEAYARMRATAAGPPSDARTAPAVARAAHKHRPDLRVIAEHSPVNFCATLLRSFGS